MPGLRSDVRCRLGRFAVFLMPTRNHRTQKVTTLPPVLDVEKLRAELNRKLFMGRKAVSTAGARARFDRVMRFVDELNGQGFEVHLDVDFKLKLIKPEA